MNIDYIGKDGKNPGDRTQIAPATGLEGLLAFDSDRDGVLTAADARFGEFKLWIDVDGDGRSTASEMQGLAEFGITSIGLEILGRQAIDHDLSFGQPLGWSTIARTDGQARAIDTAFRIIRDALPDRGCGGSSWYVDAQLGDYDAQQTPAGS